MVIATEHGWGDGASIARAVVRAFLFGYGLTCVPSCAQASRCGARGRGHAVVHDLHAH